MRLSDFTTLSFDCYGTLIDWETGLFASLRPILRRSGVAPESILELYGRIEHEVEEQHPGMRYSQLLELVYQRLGEELQVDTGAEECVSFGASVGDWPAFPDVPDALRYLKQHFRLVILSNVDKESFSRSNERLEVEFDHVFTAEDIGSYKPSLRNFEYMLARLDQSGTAKSDLLHVAQSLFHDHGPANRLGIASAWIDRRHGKSGWGATLQMDPQPHFDFRFRSLEELAEAHRSER